MDQMADEMTLRADVKDKGRVNTAEESSTWVRGEAMEDTPLKGLGSTFESSQSIASSTDHYAVSINVSLLHKAVQRSGERIQSEAKINDWSLASADTEPGETGRDTDTQQPRECDSSCSPLFSLKMYLRRSSSAESSSTDSLSSSQQSSMGVDCAGFVLNCLFCRFYDIILMLPASCERAVNHCCPSYRQVVTAMETEPNSNDDSCLDWDCGMFNSCHDAGDCLELAMEVSEICYH